ERLRSRMPTCSTIHSSLVSTIRARSAFVRTSSGCHTASRERNIDYFFLNRSTRATASPSVSTFARSLSEIEMLNASSKSRTTSPRFALETPRSLRMLDWGPAFSSAGLFFANFPTSRLTSESTSLTTSLLLLPRASRDRLGDELSARREVQRPLCLDGPH